ncbi:CG2 omega domain protein [Vibrio sp. SCSIO 43140]|uniref:CG2 omega domain protein n=1 Tax=Vibrio sp. SCSIO 43140 TaxID=2819100 RepID=UPI002076455B|nr:CG2 omega domain protein [Vibrio sp. SCSIO 43140]USD61783.1 CG2 omega domain protein [Vibrio sp. SCSIO 43140]
MKTLLPLSLALLFSLPMAHADVTIKGDRMEISEDCRKIEGEVMTLRSEDCESDSKGSHKNKGKGENRSVHGDDNPGKGHDKKNKDKDDD